GRSPPTRLHSWSLPWRWSGSVDAGTSPTPRSGGALRGSSFVGTHPILRAQIVIIAYTAMGGHFIDGGQYVFAYKEAPLTPGLYGLALTLSSLGAFAGLAVVKPVTARLGVGPSIAVGFGGFAIMLAFLPLALVLPAVVVITVVFFVCSMTDTVTNV